MTRWGEGYGNRIHPCLLLENECILSDRGDSVSVMSVCLVCRVQTNMTVKRFPFL